MSTGRTKPCLIGCIAGDEAEIELVVKFKAGCELKERAMAVEAISAMLAADLGLPVSEPFVVAVGSEFAATIPSAQARDLAKASVGWNFGSRLIPHGFSILPKGRPLSPAMLAAAMEILAFDVLIANPDRRVGNPNCQVKGEQFSIYDHEQAFFIEEELGFGWRPPWKKGGLNFLRNQAPSDRHIFYEALTEKDLEFGRLTLAFGRITEDRLNEYRNALPAEWTEGSDAVNRILDYIARMRDNLHAALEELRGALR